MNHTHLHALEVQPVLLQVARHILARESLHVHKLQDLFRHGLCRSIAFERVCEPVCAGAPMRSDGCWRRAVRSTTAGTDDLLNQPPALRHSLSMPSALTAATNCWCISTLHTTRGFLALLPSSSRCSWQVCCGGHVSGAGGACEQRREPSFLTLLPSSSRCCGAGRAGVQGAHVSGAAPAAVRAFRAAASTSCYAHRPCCAVQPGPQALKCAAARPQAAAAHLAAR